MPLICRWFGQFAMLKLDKAHGARKRHRDKHAGLAVHWQSLKLLSV
jgi:hypothetical protein